jgi:hypothetical protein
MAAMAMRPCLSSQARYLAREPSFWLRPRGSQIPPVSVSALSFVEYVHWRVDEHRIGDRSSASGLRTRPTCFCRLWTYPIMSDTEALTTPRDRPNLGAGGTCNFVRCCVVLGRGVWVQRSHATPRKERLRLRRQTCDPSSIHPSTRPRQSPAQTQLRSSALTKAEARPRPARRQKAVFMSEVRGGGPACVLGGVGWIHACEG